MPGKWWQWLMILLFLTILLSMGLGAWATYMGCTPKPAYRYRSLS